jgi:hypothetical protein
VLLTFIPRASLVAKAPPSLTRRCFCLTHLHICPNSRPPFRVQGRPCSTSAATAAQTPRSLQHLFCGSCGTDPRSFRHRPAVLVTPTPRSFRHRLCGRCGTESAVAAAPTVRSLRHRLCDRCGIDGIVLVALARGRCGTHPTIAGALTRNHCSTNPRSLRQQHCDRDGTDSAVTAPAAPTAQ